jgi:hypothetical protein
MNVLAAFSGDYITADSFDGKVPMLTIDHVQKVDLEDDKGKTRSRPVVYFRETKRGWVLNKTSAQALSALFGHETDKWAGKRVSLGAELVQFGKERVLGIRVRGSPDIASPVTFDLKLPRKRPQKVTLVPTGGKPAPGPAPTAEPVIDPETGEVFP